MYRQLKARRYNPELQKKHKVKALQIANLHKTGMRHFHKVTITLFFHFIFSIETRFVTIIFPVLQRTVLNTKVTTAGKMAMLEYVTTHLPRLILGRMLIIPDGKVAMIAGQIRAVFFRCSNQPSAVDIS